VAPSVYVIVLNWNGWHNTAACLSSLQKLQYDNRRDIVVDNGSTDDSAARIRREFPQAELIEAGTNLGFAGGCNVGIRRALADGADYVWLLNNDTKVDPTALRALVEKAETDPQIGAVGSAIYSMEAPQRLQVWGGGKVSFLLGGSRHFFKPVGDEKIQYITGASLFLRRAALDTVGLLDEGFFFYWEDSDLCFRLRQAGWRLAVAARSAVWHKESASLRGENTLLDTYFNQGAVRFFEKHAPVPQFSLWIGGILRLGKRLVRGDWNRARAVWTSCWQVTDKGAP
jgi:GT2 family glycosyltransferase